MEVLVENGEAEKVAAVVVLFSSVKPRLSMEAPKANDVVSFYKAAFGAEEVGRTLHPKRKAKQELPLVLSAEQKIGGFSILVSDLTHDSIDAPKSEGNKVVVCLETEDVGVAITKVVSAGAVEEEQVEEGEGARCDDISVVLTEEIMDKLVKESVLSKIGDETYAINKNKKTEFEFTTVKEEIEGLIHDARKTASKIDDITCKKRCLNAYGLSSSREKSDVERVKEAMI
ncbi:Glyoxalase/Bleomycin resistance protein/Dihydroxybiphenyl dioxygenase [Sesbania bispinosa]|nr:Glyoxalase/Bleomycin resistance protein/Dihydroxybiphenyl dioxygenase [Sesbania bispinosa]